MSAPDLTTEVVGYRQWYVTPELELRSCGLRSEKWTRGNATAACRRQSYDPFANAVPLPNPCGDCPGPECECGFYALHDPSDHWYGNGTTWLGSTETDTLVSGIIVAWGNLQVHHQGFRSQHARIAALALPKTKRDQVVARAVAGAYGVPCVPAEDLPKIAAEYGSTVPVEFRPEKPAPKADLLYSKLAQLMGNSGYLRGGSLAWGSTAPLHYSSSSYLTFPSPTSAALWTPEDDKGKTADDKLANYRKPPANRRGPEKPRRAPKKLGGGR